VLSFLCPYVDPYVLLAYVFLDLATSEKIALFYPASLLADSTLSHKNRWGEAGEVTVTNCPSDMWAVGVEVFGPTNGTLPESPKSLSADQVYGLALSCTLDSIGQTEASQPTLGLLDLSNELHSNLGWNTAECDEGEVRL
jgi:hypothetical protein